MPIVKPRLEVEISADAKQALKEADRFIRKMDEAKKEFQAQQKALNNQDAAVKGGISSFTELSSAVNLAREAYGYLQDAYKATVGELVTYGDQVQKLSAITGQSAEETSRQIQMADDLRVSYESLAVSLRFASKKGIDTSIEGLIKLGEEYKKLPKGIERTQFLMENFGRQGIEMNKILEQTSDQIRNLAAGAPDGLIINDADLQALKEYNSSLDAMNDSWAAVKMGIAKDALPAITDFTNGVQVYIKLMESFADAKKSGNVIEFYKNFGTILDDAQQEIIDNTLAAREASNAFGEFGEAADETGESLTNLEDAEKRAADAAKELSRMYTGLLSSMFSIQSENERAAESEQNIANKRAELAEKEKRTQLQLWSARQQGGLTLAEEARYYQQLTDIQQEKIELDNMEVQAQENAAEASKKRIYDLVQQKLAADGLIESGEFDYLQELAVSYGLVSRESANRAIADNALADQMVSNFVKVQNPMDKSLSTMQQINAFDGRFVNFGINFQSNLPSLESIVPGFYGTSYGGPTGISARAEGGSVSAGTPYLVGERGPEMFIPSQSGQIVSNDAMGKNVNISISVASIRSPSDVDYLAQEVARRVAKV